MQLSYLTPSKFAATLLGLALAISCSAVFAREKINVPGSTVSLEIPAGFTPLTDIATELLPIQ